MANQTNSMAHTKWMCKYHIVFTPKYRRKVIYNQYKEDIRDIIKALCKYKGVEIIEGHLMPDHIHMLVSIPPKYSISQFIKCLPVNSNKTIKKKSHRYMSCGILCLCEFIIVLGQLNAYVGYYKKNEMIEGDNPPVGILLCTDKGSQMVEYALSGMDNQLFVSTYMLHLPDKKKLEEFMLKEIEEMEM